MTLPGHIVTIGERVAAPVAAPSTANGFMIGYAERGEVGAAVLCTSITDAVQKLGERVTGKPHLYDALDVAFREGASAIYVRRINPNGNAAAKNTAIEDADGKKVLKAFANSPGTWGNGLKVKVTLSGGLFSFVIEEDGAVVESTPQFDTIEEAVTWVGANSSYIVLEADEAGKDPKTQTAELKEGADDYEASAEEVEDAINGFPRDLGPGQIAAPGFTEEAVHEALLLHAAGNNRRALLDAADTDEASTIAAAATALRATEGLAARFGTMLAPWAIVPGLSPGTYRTVPYSAVQMGLIARAEAEGATPNQAAAGKRGRARFAVELTQAYSNDDRETLNDSGVIVAILKKGVVTTYGNVSLTNPVTDGNWAEFSGSRLVMGVAALADAVLDNYDFEQIDGKGAIFKDLEGDLAGQALMPYYLANSLYGTTPDEAFNVNTGPDVNTPATIAAKQINAQIAVRTSPTGEMLSVEIVKVPTTESIA